MDQVATILQEAIRDTAKLEYARLSAKCVTTRGPLTCTDAALGRLSGLQGGTQPEYDPWVALYYLTWYQYAHINFACAILDRLFGDNPIEEPIHVIDLACGAMATQFALAVYSATGSPHNRPPPSITVHNIDPSESMRSIGQTLWEQFTYISSGRCAALSRACGSIESISVSSHRELPNINPSEKRILLAMHAVYANNKDDIRDAVQQIRNRFMPTETVMTCNAKRDELVKFAGSDGWQPLSPGKLFAASQSAARHRVEEGIAQTNSIGQR